MTVNYDIARAAKIWDDHMHDDNGENVAHALHATLSDHRGKGKPEPFAIQDETLAKAYEWNDDDDVTLWWAVACNTIGSMMRDWTAQIREARAAGAEV